MQADWEPGTCVRRLSAAFRRRKPPMPVVLQNELADLFTACMKNTCAACRVASASICRCKTGHELDFAGKNLVAAEFVGAFLNHANSRRHLMLRQSEPISAYTLNNANFLQADLSQADLRGAQMQGANFTNAILNDANLADGSL